MRITGLVMAMLTVCAALFAVGCNQAEDARTTASAGEGGMAVTSGEAAASQPAATSEAAAEAGEQEALAGTQLTLASGEQVEIISVAAFDQAQNSLSGRVAIEGRVAEAFPDRGAVVLVDVDNMAGCSDGCCPQAQVPVKVNLADYAGALPAAGQQVVVVGEIVRTDLGFNLQVAQIRHGSDVVLELKGEQA